MQEVTIEAALSEKLANLPVRPSCAIQTAGHLASFRRCGIGRW